MSSPRTSPRTARSHTRRGRPRAGASALLRWTFLRASGLLLLGLVLAHLYVNLMVGDGINAVDFALVAGRYANPFWQTWSLVMLWLAMLHGAVGLAQMIDDYADTVRTRLALKGLLAVTTAVTVALGTLVIFTFDPCPATASPERLPSFCTSERR